MILFLVSVGVGNQQEESGRWVTGAASQLPFFEMVIDRTRSCHGQKLGRMDDIASLHMEICDELCYFLMFLDERMTSKTNLLGGIGQ